MSLFKAWGSPFFGGTWFVVVFHLPQMVQIAHGTSALQAGVRPMPFTFAALIGSIVTSTLAGKRKVPPVYILIAAACI
ncbi:uncharacterized protein BDR25DRAFT_230526 [Lindgomyces ingoldianus]|uniref:Uncharacterized protein n=1 Tax=Lindgomyces ingoldianus TaxID=673940 RepID=A0ACB6QQJ7_9PLEO|nr:uncharacterized protein BDR25DRAFT_230526 [Lindgomyces ingoldianus]KAF2468805.1 hypothetical protein BDR25DRAFT_230526 [Lindgomyces ingoldianus]